MRPTERDGAIPGQGGLVGDWDLVGHWDLVGDLRERERSSPTLLIIRDWEFLAMGGRVGFLVSDDEDIDPPRQAAIFPTGLGWMWCQWHAGRLERNSFGFGSSSSARESLGGRWRSALVDDVDAGLVSLVERLERYAVEFADDFLDVPLALDDAPPFARRVLQACRCIPMGQTISYAELARRGGSPRAARAAGNTMARNRFPLVVPCHRVVGSHGSLGGYSAPSGLNMKRRLLASEARTSNSHHVS